MGRARKKSTARRWWVLPLALGIAAAAGYALLRDDPGPPPLDHIDDASRERLEDVLREAEDVPATPRGGR